jgi:two-component system, LuxR family, sensor kinase FixL
MEKPLRVLMVDDSEDDVLLTVRELEMGGYDLVYDWLQTAEAMRAALQEKTWDVILCDYRMPQFNALAALALLKETNVDIPFIIVSGAIGEETAVEAMTAGAHNYVMKGNLSRLVTTIERELKEAESRLQRKLAEEKIKQYSAELIKKDEELRDMTQQLWQVAKLATMGELAASIAHELNNPLTTVTLRVESLLMKTRESSSIKRELEIIEQEVARMGILVANLLQFSRRGRPHISTLDVREEIEKTLELVYYHLNKNNIIIKRECVKEVPLIHADRQHLRQLFLNLFTNASDAMPQGGTLTIRVTMPPESGQVIIEVADTGTGIPPDILPKVREPFYTTKPEGKGTGLGLAICRRIAQEHGGTFDLTSEGIPGRGTTARVSLPVTNGKNAVELT